MLHKETVETATLELIHSLMNEDELKSFFLVGGTALALMIGHRISVDIDLFTENSFDATTLAKFLHSKYRVENLETDPNTINCFINDVKVDCMAHRYPWIEAPQVVEGIRMASMLDIAAMKLNAIVINGSRIKDYIDIYVMLEHISLATMVTSYTTKYDNTFAKTALTALQYHEDLNTDQMINLLSQNITWNEVEKRLKSAIINPQKIFAPEHLLMSKKRISKSRGRRL